MPKMRLERPRTGEILKYSNISFDVDGCLAYSGVPVVEEFNKLFGTNKKPSDLDHWDCVQHWAMDEGLSEVEAHEVLIKLWYTPEILLKSPPVEGAEILLGKLYDYGVKPQIITSREARSAEMTREWFKIHFPFVDQNTINLCNTNVREDRKMFKANTIKSLGIALHIEDSLEDTEKILEVDDKVEIMLVPHKYNYKIKPMPRVIEYDEIEVDLNKEPTLYPVYKKLFVGK